MKYLNILFETFAYKPAYELGGPTHSVPALAEALVARGHKVTVFTSNAQSQDDDLEVATDIPTNVDGVEVWYFQRKKILRKYLSWFPYFSNSVGFFYCPRLTKELHNKISEFDIVHTHSPFSYLHWRVSRAAISSGIPLFYHQRGTLSPKLLKYRRFKKLLFLKFIELPIIRKCSSLVALNENERDYYLDLDSNLPIKIISNGVNIITSFNRYSCDFMRELNINDDDFIILFMARLNWKKGAEFLLNVFCQISDFIPNAKLVIAGHDEGNLTNILNNIISRNNLSHRVLLPGHIFDERKLDLLKRADLFCLPSLGEGFSMAVLEAMSQSTPVIITPECNFPEIESKNAGWILPRDENSWISTLKDVCMQKELLKSKGERAYSLVLKNYTWDKIAELTELLYLEHYNHDENQ